MSAKEDTKTTHWDISALRRFKRDYIESIECGESQFRFDGEDYDVSYAKYLIEFLEGEMT